MRKYNFGYSTIFLLLLTLAFSCTKSKRDDLKPVASQNIMQILEKDAKYSILVTALKRTELDKQLASVGPYTLFAPTNDAFTATLGSDAATAVTQLPIATLTRILRYHIYAMRITSGTFIPTVSTNLSTTGFVPNDNIYVTFVPSIADEAPTNDGFFNNQVYAYMGCLGTLSINGIKVTTPDIAATNGIIQEIGRVALPPTQNLYEFITARSTIDMGRLKRAVDRLGLAGTLSNLPSAGGANGAFTAFLPTDAAFAAAGFPDDASINNAPIGKLQDFIQYHLVRPPVLSGAFVTNLNLRNRLVFPSAVIANGQKFLPMGPPLSNELLRPTASVTQTGITINAARPRTTDLFGISGLNGNANNARVVESDVMLVNGIAHVIDRVLDPTAQP
jgi:uncharacterized surface protein with fasciclin (FAS1) repeats